MPKPGAEEVKQLADSTEAICFSLSGEMLKQSAKIEHDKSINPKSHSRLEDNFGHHAGHKGWIQCRAYGKAEEDEQAGRQAALTQAKSEERMAKEYKKQILACGDDVAAARKVFEDMRQVRLWRLWRLLLMHLDAKFLQVYDCMRERAR